jgi:hypothetical protein
VATTAAVPTASLVSKSHTLPTSAAGEDGEQCDGPAGDGAETFAGLPGAGEEGGMG